MVLFVYPVWRGEPHSCNFRFFHLENLVFLPCHCHHWADCSFTVIVPLPHTTPSLPRPFKLNQDVQLLRWSRRSWSTGKGMLEPLPPANRALPCHFPPHNGGQTLPYRMAQAIQCHMSVPNPDSSGSWLLRQGSWIFSLQGSKVWREGTVLRAEFLSLELHFN